MALPKLSVDGLQSYSEPVAILIQPAGKQHGLQLKNKALHSLCSVMHLLELRHCDDTQPKPKQAVTPPSSLNTWVVHQV